MTLAAILSVCLLCSAPTPLLGAASAWIQSAGQQPDSAPPAASIPAQDNSADSKPQTAPSTQTPATPAATPKQTPPGQKPAPAVRHKRRVKKPVNPSDCASVPATGNPTPAGASASGNAAAGATAPPSSPCPPPKKIVRNGGTSEPEVQLTGGANAEQASHTRSTTEQLLGSAEENLKKISGRQLTSSQQEIVTQIHQFMAQSKVAVAAGDIERGHNLALKAHLLSDELVKPQ